MEFLEPSKTGFTVYTKSGCPNCSKVKLFFREKQIDFFVVDCDDYLIENKPNFLLFIKSKSNTETVSFPIIFNDGFFVGGYNETREYVEKMVCFDDSF